MLFYTITTFIYLLVGYFFVLTFKHIKDMQKNNNEVKTPSAHKSEMNIKKINQEFESLDLSRVYNLSSREEYSNEKLPDEALKKITMYYLMGSDFNVKNKSLTDSHEPKEKENDKKLYSYKRGSTLEKVIN